MMRTLIILGSDKIAGSAAAKIDKMQEDSKIVIDRSTNFLRVKKLLQSGALSPILVCKMACCEVMRRDKRPSMNLQGISSNSELLKVIIEFEPDRLILFRAGLIISKKILETSVPVLNIHAATVPDFGGIGSINKALESNAYDQNACLHVVTSRIDEGRVLDKENYTLDPSGSYCSNEAIAYKAAETLLIRSLKENYDVKKDT